MAFLHQAFAHPPFKSQARSASCSASANLFACETRRHVASVDELLPNLRRKPEHSERRSPWRMLTIGLCTARGILCARVEGCLNSQSTCLSSEVVRHTALFFSFFFRKQDLDRHRKEAERVEPEGSLSRTWCMRPCSCQPSVRYLPES